MRQKEYNYDYPIRSYKFKDDEKIHTRGIKDGVPYHVYFEKDGFIYKSAPGAYFSRYFKNNPKVVEIAPISLNQLEFKVEIFKDHQRSTNPPHVPFSRKGKNPVSCGNGVIRYM